MQLRSLITLLVSGFCAVQAVSIDQLEALSSRHNKFDLQHKRSETNAQRFARGLPPLPPRKLYSGTPTYLAPRANPSGKPTNSEIKGNIAIKEGDTVLYYMTPSNTLVSNKPATELYSLKIPPTDSTVTTIGVTLAGNDGYYFGPAFPNGGPSTPPNIASGSDDYLHFMTLSFATPAGTPTNSQHYKSEPKAGSNYNSVRNLWEETTVWTVNKSNGNLGLKYFNGNGAQASVEICIHRRGNTAKLFGTGDLAKLQTVTGSDYANFGGGAQYTCGVTLQFV